MKKQKIRNKSKTVALPTNATKPPSVQLPDRLGIQWHLPYQNLRGKSLFVATPMYGGMCTGMFTKCLTTLTEICKEIGITLNLHFLFNESLIQRGRNYCCDEFLRARVGNPPPEGEEDTRPFFSHMLFIDADISFDPRDILCMLALSDPGSDKDIICGPYPKKCISWEKIKAACDSGVADKDPNVLDRFVGDYVFNPKPNETGRTPLTAPVEILEGGTGFMLIQRQAFEKFKAKFPNQEYRPDHVRTKYFDGSRPIHAYFDCVIDRGYTFDDVKALMQKCANGDEDVQSLAIEMLDKEKSASLRYLSEDYMFCRYAAMADCKIWLLPWIKLQHTGTYIFGGSLIDICLIGQSATADPTRLGGKK